MSENEKNYDDNSVIGRLFVTLTFTVDVYDLSDFEAGSLKVAAENAQKWYYDGSSDIVGDFSCDPNPTITVVPLNE